MMILGAFTGFVMSLGFGLSQEASWPAILGRSCVGALVAGWLLRWWSNLWLLSLKEANQLRLEKAKLEAKKQAEAEANPASSKPTAATHQP